MLRAELVRDEAANVLDGFGRIEKRRHQTIVAEFARAVLGLCHALHHARHLCFNLIAYIFIEGAHRTRQRDGFRDDVGGMEVPAVHRRNGEHGRLNGIDLA